MSEAAASTESSAFSLLHWYTPASSARTSAILRLPAPTRAKRLFSRLMRSTVAPSFSHVICGAGLPLAAQSSVAVAPDSRTVFDGVRMNSGAVVSWADAIGGIRHNVRW